MTGADADRLRATFDEDAALYDRARPRYPAQVFADLSTLGAIGPGYRALEIGCGTGQATIPLAERGCAVVACSTPLAGSSTPAMTSASSSAT